jgi:hypothetical protein
MIDVFDQMVDDIVHGEIMIAEFDSGLTITVDYETLSLTDMDEEDGFDIILNGEVLDTIHLFLEARHAARHSPIDVNWDQFLIGITEGL